MPPPLTEWHDSLCSSHTPRSRVQPLFSSTFLLSVPVFLIQSKAWEVEEQLWRQIGRVELLLSIHCLKQLLQLTSGVHRHNPLGSLGGAIRGGKLCIYSHSRLLEAEGVRQGGWQMDLLGTKEKALTILTNVSPLKQAAVTAASWTRFFDVSPSSVHISRVRHLESELYLRLDLQISEYKVSV